MLRSASVYTDADILHYEADIAPGADTDAAPDTEVGIEAEAGMHASEEEAEAEVAVVGNTSGRTSEAHSSRIAAVEVVVVAVVAVA